MISIQKYQEEMIKIQDCILEYLDHDDKIDENYENLKLLFSDIKIHDNTTKIKSVLYILANIANNHYRITNFFSKIEKILNIFKQEMTKYFSNLELFNIFRNNKRLLLFLFDEKIITIDKIIIQNILLHIKYINYNYLEYFAPEIKPFINEEWFKKKWVEHVDDKFDNFINNLPEDFYEKRKIGENDDIICELIQKDSIKDFIVHVNKNSYKLNSSINSSIYETNIFLLKEFVKQSYLLKQYKKKPYLYKNFENKGIQLIEYAAFHGSIQIFNYLRLNGAEITPSLWLHAIHGQNPEIINFLEDNKINPINESYRECLKESIKCHHNDISEYLLNNCIKEISSINDGVKYYNFKYIDFNDTKLFFDLCKWDYILPVQLILKSNNIDVNQISIKNKEMREETLYENQKKNDTIVSTEIPHGNNTLTIKKTALHVAIEKENIELIQLLLNTNNIDVNIKTYESFNEPRDAEYGCWCRDELYYDNYFISTEKTALYIATEKNNLEIVKLLLNHKDIQVNTLSFVRKLLFVKNDDEIDIDNTTGKTALEVAVKNENIEIVQQLLMHKNINVNVKCSKIGVEYWMGYGGGNDDIYMIKTVLHTAVKRENCELVKLLLANDNIDVNIKHTYRRIRYDRHGASFNDYEKTALFIAVEKGNENIIQLLLNNKNIDINIKSLDHSFYCNEKRGDGFYYIYAMNKKYFKEKFELDVKENNNDKEEDNNNDEEEDNNNDEEEDNNNDEEEDNNNDEEDSDIDEYRSSIMTPLQLAKSLDQSKICNFFSIFDKKH